MQPEWEHYSKQEKRANFVAKSILPRLLTGQPRWLDRTYKQIDRTKQINIARALISANSSWYWCGYEHTTVACLARTDANSSFTVLHSLSLDTGKRKGEKWNISSSEHQTSPPPLDNIETLRASSHIQRHTTTVQKAFTLHRGLPWVGRPADRTTLQGLNRRERERGKHTSEIRWITAKIAKPPACHFMIFMIIQSRKKASNQEKR